MALLGDALLEINSSERINYDTPGNAPAFDAERDEPLAWEISGYLATRLA
jgi:hypothetical protein